MSETLVHVVRGELVESLHTGDAVIVDNLGTVLWSVGDPYRVTYARSSAKPLQALPLVESGAADAFNLTDEEVALCCASHRGEPMHVEGVRKLLDRLGFDESYLQCGIHPPRHIQSYEELIRGNTPVSAIYNNCSGKHTGMLAMAKYLGADTSSYLNPDHPVQQRILAVVSELCEVPKNEIQIGVDGCGVPVFGLPIANLALAFAKFAQPDGIGIAPERARAMKRIATAMMSHPELVAGTDQFCTRLMQVGAGRLLGKTGAEGVYCVGVVEHGYGLCVKVDDGNPRGSHPTVIEALQQAELVPHEVIDELEAFHHPILKNHQGTVVGHIDPVFQMKKHERPRD